MTDETNSSTVHTPAQPRNGRCQTSRGLRHGIAAAALLAVGAIAGAAIIATTDAFAFGGHGGFGHRDRGSAEHMVERMRHKVSWMLAAVDATEDQERRIDGILSATVDRLAPLGDARRVARDDLVSELLAGEVNRDRLEQLRQSGMALFDQSSAVMIDAMAQAAEVLTPEQRQALLTKHRHLRH